MTEPRQIEPVTFLQSADSPVTRSDAMSQHPSGGRPVAEVKSLQDYYQRTKDAGHVPTEDQLAFRRHVQGGGVAQQEFLDDDIPEFLDDDIPEV